MAPREVSIAALAASKEPPFPATASCRAVLRVLQITPLSIIETTSASAALLPVPSCPLPASSSPLPTSSCDWYVTIRRTSKTGEAVHSSAPVAAIATQHRHVLRLQSDSENNGGGNEGGGGDSGGLFGDEGADGGDGGIGGGGGLGLGGGGGRGLGGLGGHKLSSIFSVVQSSLSKSKTHCFGNRVTESIS